MTSQAQAVSTSVEFLKWIAWWMVFLLLQRRICRRHPGLRTVCRMLFLWTLAVAVAPGVWTLAFYSVNGPRVVSLVNHAFGLGVLAQTVLRSLMLVRWLARPWPQAPVSERYVVAALVALSGVMRETRRPLPAEAQEAALRPADPPQD
jgi:hypothetical protein